MINANLKSEQDVKDLESEIIRNRKVLDGVYASIENLKQDKNTLENDILKTTKHASFLANEQKIKEHQIAIKNATIVNLDTQIEDKAKQCRSLESDISSLDVLLNEKKTDLAKIEADIIKHQKYIAETNEATNEQLRLVNEKHAKVEEKITKLNSVLSTL